jgi:hypothetical protein
MHHDHSWCIVWTAMRSERIVARRFAAHRIVHFLPLARVRRQYAGQWLDVEVPVFPGCVFAAAADVQTLLNAGAADAPQLDSPIRKIQVVADQPTFRSQIENLARSLQQPVSSIDPLSSIDDLTASMRALLLCDREPSVLGAPPGTAAAAVLDS